MQEQSLPNSQSQEHVLVCSSTHSEEAAAAVVFENPLLMEIQATKQARSTQRSQQNAQKKAADKISADELHLPLEINRSVALARCGICFLCCGPDNASQGHTTAFWPDIPEDQPCPMYMYLVLIFTLFVLQCRASN